MKAQWAQVENQLKRRNDLIPNLVETTKGFAQQERDVFEAIANSRAKLAGARTPEETMTAANEQSSALSHACWSSSRTTRNSARARPSPG